MCPSLASRSTLVVRCSIQGIEKELKEKEPELFRLKEIVTEKVGAESLVAARFIVVLCRLIGKWC
jgi:hypothetical protein